MYGFGNMTNSVLISRTNFDRGRDLLNTIMMLFFKDRNIRIIVKYYLYDNGGNKI